MSAVGGGWSEDGDRHRSALVDAVDAVLAGRDGAVGGDVAVGADGVDSEGGAVGADGGGLSALEAVCSCFGLSTFERRVLLLAVAAELRPDAPVPTFAHAFAAFDDAHWSATTPVAPLRRWRLVEPDPGPVLTAARLRVDERVLHFLLGVPYLDDRLRGLVSRVDVPDDLPGSHREAAGAVAGWWAEGPHAHLVGADRHTRWEVAASAARSAGVALHALSSDDVPSTAVEREALCALWEREALLLPSALLVEVTGREQAAARAFVDGLGVPVVVSADDPVPAGRRPWPRVVLDRPTQDEQRALWRSALDGSALDGSALNGSASNGGGAGVPEERLRDLVAQFSLPAHVIRSAGTAVRRASGDPAELAWRAGLDQARLALDELGQRIEPRAVTADLVLPEAQRAVLREVLAHVRQRSTVYQRWGFEQVLRRGLGVTALFAGGSGTGKTLAAEVLAGELGLDLFVIDLSQVISKYIGETEKNLRRVFDAAEGGGALLLFDEADALFGKRSEIKDSHDRYANIEVSYLLMRMESYRGLAILTTNMKKALDTAFLRRIRFVVDFPFPGQHERAEIWRRVIPADTPTAGVDARRLAQLTVAGGSIRNIALSAAFLAAEQDVPLGMRHVLAAARTEYLKLDRSLTSAEVAGWV
ncbi:ATP-binding protein [Saccharothrix sp. Mg75]|uniref:ATP-binding protein n=1 Tax=Saccharothrix sp. Mg75 TaxID=3445357 RepID=UPI003EE88D16